MGILTFADNQRDAVAPSSQPVNEAGELPLRPGVQRVEMLDDDRNMQQFACLSMGGCINGRIGWESARFSYSLAGICFSQWGTSVSAAAC